MNSLPFFYQEQVDAGQPVITLDGDTSRHITGVLRMKTGDAIHLTDGRGQLLTAEITDDNKQKCDVRITASHLMAAPARKVTLGVSLVKNRSRFEWFLEKATEIGI